MPRAKTLLTWFALFGAGLSAPLAGYESDQYSNRSRQIADSREQLNTIVNEELAKLADRQRRRPTHGQLAYRVYRRLGGRHWVDKVEREAMKSPDIERLPRQRWSSVYSGAPFRATRVGFIFGISPTLRLNGVLLGSDKLGHFFSQGLKYFRRFLRHGSAAQTLRRGAFAERWLFGQLTTSVFSNADLVANYEGFLFYRGLLEDGVVAGRPALFAWRDGRLEQQRPFDWADHVTDYWDEALNPSFYARALQRWMDAKLPQLCPRYRETPELFVPADEEELERRYAEVYLKPALGNRIDQVCSRAAE